MAALMIGYVHYGLSILNVQEQVIRIFTGGLLIVALLIPTIASRFRNPGRARTKEASDELTSTLRGQ